ncbi:MAG: hypothetical protein JXQ65_04925 [Candidatus Marinimicrobia bacterium]|nr:hypothetical protein [Candidatus Neomarinimicrobiota bacterium]
MKNIHLEFFNPDPKLFLLLLLIALVTLISFRKSRHKKGFYTLFFFRNVIWVIILLLFMKPVLKWQEVIDVKPKIEIWVDNSLSLQKNKNFNSKELQANIKSVSQQIKDNDLDLNMVLFDSEIRKTANLSDLNFSGMATNISNLFRNRDQRIDAALLISDGQINAGESVYSMERITDFPVFTIGIGDTARKIDASIIEVDGPQKTKVNEKFTIKGEIFLPETSARALVRLLENGKSIHSKEIQAGRDQFMQSVAFEVSSDEPGEKEYTLQIENSNDENQNNNIGSVLVNILPGQKDILILCHAPSFETRGLMTIFNQNPDYDATVAFFKNGVINLKDHYELIILAGFPGKLTSELELQQASRFITPETPVIVYAGRHADKAKLNTLLKREILKNIKPSHSTIIVKEISAGNPVLREIPDKKNWDQLPPLDYSFQEIQLAAEFDELLVTMELHSKPVFAVSKKKSVAIFAGEDFWRWNMMTDNPNYRQMLYNTIHYLLEPSDNSKIQISTPKKNFLVGEEAHFSGMLYDLTGNEIKNAEIRISVLQDSVLIDNFYLNWDKNKYQGHYTLQSAGNYTVEITTRIAGEEIEKKQLALQVKDRILEYTQTGLNRDLLAFLSKESGGEIITFDQIQKMIAMISPQSRTTFEERKFIFNTHGLLFGLLLLALVSEWIFRKYFGYL